MQICTENNNSEIHKNNESTPCFLFCCAFCLPVCFHDKQDKLFYIQKTSVVSNCVLLVIDATEGVIQHCLIQRRFLLICQYLQVITVKNDADFLPCTSSCFCFAPCIPAFTVMWLPGSVSLCVICLLKLVIFYCCHSRVFRWKYIE